MPDSAGIANAITPTTINAPSETLGWARSRGYIPSGARMTRIASRPPKMIGLHAVMPAEDNLSCTITMISAPTIGPAQWRRPPSTLMTITVSGIVRLKIVSVDTKPICSANSAPPIPPSAPPITMAIIL